jgi:hypothetical protein
MHKVCGCPPNPNLDSQRLRRIERRAIPALKNALADGVISLRKAESLVRMPAQEQLDQIAGIIAAKTLQEQIARRAQVAAAVIKKHIDANHHDLLALKRDLQLALSSPTTLTHA